MKLLYFWVQIILCSSGCSEDNDLKMDTITSTSSGHQPFIDLKKLMVLIVQKINLIVPFLYYINI